jgi:hypothetical protein
VAVRQTLSLSSHAFHRLLTKTTSTEQRLHYLLNLARPWSACLLLELGQSQDDVWQQCVRNRRLPVLLGAIRTFLVTGVSSITEQRSEPVYAYDLPGENLIARSLVLKSRAKAAKSLHAAAAYDFLFKERDAVSDMLRKCVDQSALDPMLVTRRISVGLEGGSISDSAIRVVVQNRPWRDAFVASANFEMQKYVAEVLMSAQTLYHDDWDVVVPHLFAELCERSVNENSREHWFIMTVRSSVCGQSVSAMHRLTKGSSRDVSLALRKTREIIEAVSKQASPWQSARLSSALSVLNGFE